MSFSGLKSYQPYSRRCSPRPWCLALPAPRLPLRPRRTRSFTRPTDLRACKIHREPSPRGRDGNMYAVSNTGGTFYGTAFKFSPSGGALVINDVGYFPSGGLTLGTDGNFYGGQDGRWRRRWNAQDWRQAARSIS